MSITKANAIKEFLEFLIKSCNVISYGKLARKFQVSMRSLLNLLREKLPHLCYVVVGYEKGVFILSSNRGICDYQVKKLSEMIQLLPLDSLPNFNDLVRRVEKNLRSFSDLRVIPFEYVCEEELEDLTNPQTGTEKPQDPSK